MTVLQTATAGARLGAALLTAALAAAACGGGGEPSPTAVPSPAVTATPTAAPTPSPSPALPSRAIDLAGTDAILTTVYGADSGDLLSDIPGLAAGDFNGDGFQDIVIGARFGDGPDNGREDAGEAYVVFGSAQPPETVDIAAGEQDLTVYGADEAGDLGFSAAGGDINGDGIDDILLGAPFAGGARGTGGAGAPGAVYAVFGRPDLAGTVDIALGQQGLTVLGPGPGALFGDSLALGDVNGDGATDIIIGSTFAADGERGVANAGAVYAVFGSADLPATVRTEAGEHDAVIFGAEPFDELGDTVASADVNGDGVDDIIATAEAADGPDNDRPVAAEVHLVFGRDDLGGVLRVSEGDQDVSFYGAEQNDTLGFDLAAGDLDGDGAAEIIMGARLADGPDNARSQGGEVYVMFGGDDLPASVDIALDQQDLTVFGAGPSDFFGSSLTVGDLDGDGDLEAVLGASFGSGPGDSRTAAGEAYVVGPLAPGVIDMADGGHRLAVYGAEPGDTLGSSLAAADVDGDGADELLLVAPGAPGLTGVPQAGRVYVLSPRFGE